MRIYILIFLLFIASIGCSGNSGTPLSPNSGTSSNDISNAPLVAPAAIASTGLFGAYELLINPDSNSAELVSKRLSSLGESWIVSGAGFFTMSPCSDCFKVKSVELDLDGNVILNFSIKHPFQPGDPFKPPTGINRLDLDVFDLACVIAPVETVPNSYTLTGTDAYPGFCLGADGYTAELANLIDNDAALPYYLVVDDSIDGISTWNKFEMGAESEFAATFDLSLSSLNFDLYLTMGYGASAKKSQRLNPMYYNPEFNRKAAWKVAVTPPNGDLVPEVGNTWSNSDSTTPFDVVVEVYDWQIDAVVEQELSDPSYIYAASGVSAVSCEIPGMTSTLPTLITPDAPATGLPDDPLVYTFSIANENLIPEGNYFGLVKVSDERPVLTPMDFRDHLIHTPDGIVLENYEFPEYATYQAFPATVVIGTGVTLTAPNGGETWLVGSPHNITWTTLNNSGDIKLEYSKDDFTSDINEIIAATEDDGVFEWSIPNDESTTVKVRASLVDVPAAMDDSDDYFTIEKAPYEWVFDTVDTFAGGGYGGVMHDISPALIEESDNDIALSWAQTDTDHLYPGIDSVFRLRRSVDNGVSYGFEDYGDIASDNLERCDRNKMAAGAQSDAYAMSCFAPYHANGAYISLVEQGHPYWAVWVCYPSRDMEVFVDSTGYIYGFGDAGANLTYKHSQNPNSLLDWVWNSYPVYQVDTNAYCSHVRSIGDDSSNTTWLAYYDSSETTIKLAYSLGASPYHNWDATTVAYTAGANISEVKNPGLSIDPDDDFHICYTRFDSSTSNYQLVYVTDDSSFSSPSEQILYESATEINDGNISVGEKFGSEVIVVIFENNQSVYLHTLIDGALLDSVPIELDVNTDDIDPDVILDMDQCDLHAVWTTMGPTNYDIARRNGVLTQS